MSNHQARWNQALLTQGNTESVAWVRNAATGDTLKSGWTVARVYAPAVGTCGKCGGRTAFPGSPLCLRCCD